MVNLINRYFPVLLLLAVCISCLFIPVSADEYDQTSYYNLLDYFSLNANGGNRVSAEGDNTFVFTTPFYGKYGYVDILVTISGGDNNISASMSNSVDGTFRDLEIFLIGTDTYRIFGSIPYSSYRNFCLKITSSVQKNRVYDFHKFDVSSNQYQNYDINGTYNLYYSQLNLDSEYPFYEDKVYTANWSTDSLFYLDYPSIADPNGGSLSESDTRFALNFSQVSKFDYIYFQVCTNMDIMLMSCFWDDTIVPFEIINPVLSFDDLSYYTIRIDLSSLERDPGILLLFYLRGVLDNDVGFIQLTEAYGIVDYGEPSMFRHFLYQLQNMFDSLNDKLDELFGASDNSAEDAIQTQEEIDVLINYQLVGAIEDWNDNIEVVESGYDLAFLKTTPALNWLASLADGIFNGMGWFGNVYFLVGLISVIMLVLSKSGLAHKINNLSTRKGG